MAIKHRLPALVTERRGSLRRTDEIGEEHRRQHPLRWRDPPLADDERGDLRGERVDIAHEGEMVAPFELDERRVRDPLRRDAQHVVGCKQVVASVEHKRRATTCSRNASRGSARIADSQIRGAVDGPGAQSTRSRVPVAKVTIGDPTRCDLSENVVLSAHVGHAALDAVVRPRFPLVVRDDKRLAWDPAASAADVLDRHGFPFLRGDDVSMLPS
jgi:hypothetical protein